MNNPTFFGTKSNLKGSPLTSKATNGYFGHGVWNWIKGNVPRFKKIRPDANNKNFMWITCGRRITCQLRAETAGNRYLRRFLPASAGIFTCGSVYLRPSQVILHAPVLQWRVRLTELSLNTIEYITRREINSGWGFWQHNLTMVTALSSLSFISKSMTHTYDSPHYHWRTVWWLNYHFRNVVLIKFNQQWIQNKVSECPVVGR